MFTSFQFILYLKNKLHVQNKFSEFSVTKDGNSHKHLKLYYSKHKKITKQFFLNQKTCIKIHKIFFNLVKTLLYFIRGKTLFYKSFNFLSVNVLKHRCHCHRNCMKLVNGKQLNPEVLLANVKNTHIYFINYTIQYNLILLMNWSRLALTVTSVFLNSLTTVIFMVLP